MEKLNLIRLADVKAYIGLLDREEITMSRFAEILNECANEALRIHDVVVQSEQFYCTCSRTKGLDYDEEGTPYCISCQKEVQ